AVTAALDPVRTAIAPGSRVCLAVGSRGIDRIDEVVRAAVSWVRSAGAEVFVVPAMGSHGGASPEGQLEVLASYGITPESIGCEIRSSMETVELGEVQPGVPVFVDRQAFEGADVIVPINRVKPHTDFTGEVESGLMKMIAIGLGKQRGADTFHRQGFASFHELIPAVAEFTISKVNIPFGLALVENGYARLWRIEAVPRDRIWDRERELLVMARDRMARLPLGSIDVLVLDYIGKDISGLGMDSNVVGRYYKGPTGAGPSIQRIVVRDLTAETEGNAVGIGMADVVLRRAVEKMDAHKTYMNCITAKTPEGARVALTVDTDRQALSVAIASCLKVEPPDARIVRIRDTKHLGLLYVSRPAIEEVLATGRCEIVRPLEAVEFDRDGMFASPME
ncbi:MAG TPA: DUF362 domain-containing protein, partial [Candidatus Limnocylindrales bacterium]|nr:DUF362 domain-containing protein [Candidatus Limnocylindrales bacterium]